MKLYFRLLGYLRPHLGIFAMSIVAMIAFAALDAFSFTLLIPFLAVLFKGSDSVAMGDVLGNGSDFIHRLLDWAVGWLVAQADPMDALRNVVLLLFAIYLAKNIALYAQQYSVAVVEGRVTRDLRNEIYDNLLRLGFPFFQRTRAGQIISRVTVDVEEVKLLVTGNLAKALSSAIQLVFFLATMLFLSWKLTLVAILALPPILGLWARLRKRLHAGVMRVLDAVGEVASQVQETVSGIRLVKASGAEAWEASRFRTLTRWQYKAFTRNERWRQFFPPASEMVIATAVLALLWFGSYLVLEDHSMEPEVFLGLLAFAMKLMTPAKLLGQYPSQVQPGLVAAERVFEILDQKPEIVERPDARRVTTFDDEIRFENVSFAYQADEPVLDGVDFSIRAGEVVALVGHSGAGKSTLADLLPRFHDPTAGRITLDGTDLRDLRIGDLRALLGIVTQDTILFHDTVRANIAYGSRVGADGPLEAAARAANAHDFITELPQEYDTVLGERGVRLSGGQRQRIALARALLRNPPILILDEATSALDSESERLVQQAIEELMSDRTVLVIAHRLSTIRRADQILVMENGRIVERGTHAKLLAQSGTYQRLYRLQFEIEDEKTSASA